MKMFLLCLCFLLKEKKVFISTEPLPVFPEAIQRAFVCVADFSQSEGVRISNALKSYEAQIGMQKHSHALRVWL